MTLSLLALALVHSTSAGTPSQPAFVSLTTSTIFAQTAPRAPEQDEITRLTQEVQRLMAARDYEKALPAARRILELIPKDNLAPRAKALMACSEILFQLAGEGEAEPLLREAVSINRALFKGEDHDDVATSLNELASALDRLGRSDDALPLFEESLEMLRRLFKGKDHQNVAASLNNLASALDHLGRSNEALPLYDESLDMRRRLANGKDSPGVATLLNNLGLGLHSLGRSNEASKLLKESLEMRERIFKGVDNQDVAHSLNNLALVLSRLGNSAEAMKLYEESLEMYRRVTKGRDHPALANLLSNLASCRSQVGNSADAMKLYEESLEMYRRIFQGKDHPRVASSLGLLSSCLNRLSRPEDALKLYEESLEMYRRLFQKDHPRVVSSLGVLSVLLDQLGRSNEADERRAEWLSVSESRAAQLSFLSDGGLSASEFANLTNSFEGLPARSWRGNYNTVAALRFRLTRTGQAAGLQEVLRVDSSLADLRNKALELAKRSMDLALSPPAGKTPAELQSLRDQAKVAAQAAQTRFLVALRDKYSDRLRIDPPTIAHVQRTLGTSGAAVDYYRRTNRKEPYYEAAVLTSAGSVRFVELAPEKEMVAAVNAVQNSMDKGKGTGSEQALIRLNALVMKPLEPLIKGKTKISISADGALAQVPFSGLISGTVADKGAASGRRFTFWIERARISLVPSMLDIAVSAPPPSGRGSVLVADVDYDADPQKPVETPGRLKRSQYAIPEKGTTRGMGKDGKWSRLGSGTQELKVLRSLSTFQGATIMAGTNATEEAVLGVQSPKYLHFTTHGFFTPKKEASNSELFADRLAQADDSMYRSGLILAGANRAEILKKDGRMDGWLTADEVSSMKLKGTRLVVIAACSSGRGDYSAGRGVLGLRRAFRTAGAHGVIMSLYEVNDAATQELMRLLYGGLSKGLSAPDALHQAQLTMLRRGYSAYNWSAFVYEGN